eukprot:g76935.t1
MTCVTGILGWLVLWLVLLSCKASAATSFNPKALGGNGEVIVKARSKHTASVIWLHGLGDSGYGWSPMASEWGKLLSHVKWIFPNAPIAPVTVNGGMEMPSWHDITRLDIVDTAGMVGVDHSRKIVEAYVRLEMAKGIPANRIAIGGFSQGAAMSVITAYQFPDKLAGVIALSGYFPKEGGLSKLLQRANKDTPALICHGLADNVVPFAAGTHLRDTLKSAGVKVEFLEFPGMAHSACPEELGAVVHFLGQVLPEN